MRCAWMRALTSTPPPAANGTINVIGRVGHSCARAVETMLANAMTPAKAAMMLCRMKALSGIGLDLRGDRIAGTTVFGPTALLDRLTLFDTASPPPERARSSAPNYAALGWG
jgi:hypothetical protein